MKEDNVMKNFKLEMILLIVTWILAITNLIVDLINGISKAETFNYICAVILIFLWSISLIMRKRGQ